jgi:hypothetical protein
VSELCKVRVLSRAKFLYCGVRSRLRLTLWRNYPPLLAIAVEFLQLMSISLRQKCVLVRVWWLTASSCLGSSSSCPCLGCSRAIHATGTSSSQAPIHHRVPAAPAHVYQRGVHVLGPHIRSGGLQLLRGVLRSDGKVRLPQPVGGFFSSTI